MKLPDHQTLHNKTTSQGPKGLCIRHNRRVEEVGFMEGEKEMFSGLKVTTKSCLMNVITKTYQGFLSNLAKVLCFKDVT